jgi:ribonuclease HIII
MMEEKGKKLMPSNVHKKCIFNAHQPNDGENIYSRAFANEENINQYIADNYGQFDCAKMILIGEKQSVNLHL